MSKNNFPLLLVLGIISISRVIGQNTFPSSGSVGIGTTSPAEALSIKATGNPQLALGIYTDPAGRGFTLRTPDFSVGSAGSSLRISQSGGSGNAYSYLQQYINGESALGDLALQPFGGKLGVNTNSLSARFSVNSGIYSSSASVISLQQATVDGTVKDAAVFGIAIQNGGESTNAADLTIGTASAGSVSERMRITSIGKIGMGTSAPDAKLHVNGVNGFPASSGTVPFGMLALRDKTNGASHGLFMGVTDAAPWGSWLQAQDANAPGTNYLLLLNPNGGNVGIGIASPSEKLSVNGNIKAKKVIVTQSGWSDYVFDNDYQLKPLHEVEQFIKINKHLPEVPSAKEVEEKGINLGDNQALLLKKIEELTLYIIELKNENMNIKAEMRQLQKHVGK